MNSASHDFTGYLQRLSQVWYVGEGGCTNDNSKVRKLCEDEDACKFYGQQSNGCWHLLGTTGDHKKYVKNYKKFVIDKRL